jgi:hypothetical protein
MKYSTAAIVLAAAIHSAEAFSPPAPRRLSQPVRARALFSSTTNNCVEEQKQKLVNYSTKRWISLDELFDYADVDQSGGVAKREMKDLLDQIRLSSSVDFDAI